MAFIFHTVNWYLKKTFCIQNFHDWAHFWGKQKGSEEHPISIVYVKYGAHFWKFWSQISIFHVTFIKNGLKLLSLTRFSNKDSTYIYIIMLALFWRFVPRVNFYILKVNHGIILSWTLVSSACFVVVLYKNLVFKVPNQNRIPTMTYFFVAWYIFNVIIH